MLVGMPRPHQLMSCTLLLSANIVIIAHGPPTAMITATQLRAARALLGIDQQTLADLSGVSLPTIQRMETSQGNVRGVVDTLTKVVEALNAAGIELLGDNTKSDGGGRGVRFREPAVKAHHGGPASPARLRKGRALIRSQSKA
jgi:transcriptional regulator with XRE-family HTH domain